MNPKIPGLYIHIPFCLTKCSYCDFYSVTSISMASSFLEALFEEMKMYRDRFESFDTVYLGGGTPSTLNPEKLGEILAGVREHFNLLPNSEITMEVNPADLDHTSLELIRNIGINRLNIGIQSFNPKILVFLGRRHSVKQAIDAIEASRKAGFTNIGLDLIYGIPGQEMNSWLDTLKCALTFEPEHLSCYQLTVEARTPIGMRYQQGEFHLPDEKLQHAFFIKTAEMLEGAGYVHYEVSNFARDMKRASQHNQKYWNHTPYLGLGPSAHSFLNNRRWWNERSLGRYITLIKSGNLPVKETERLTIEQLRLEAQYLGLRTKKGIHLKSYADQYRCNLLIEKATLLTRLIDKGLISIEGDYLYPTRSGLAMADSLALI